ncbi:UNVERIFIED_CONTAM: hypothetical protein K2H54_060202 [Gekko kuhli]
MVEVAASAGKLSNTAPMKRTVKKVGVNAVVTRKSGAPRKDQRGKPKGLVCPPETLLKMKRVAEFAVDTSQDSIQFCARAQAATIIIHRNIWLKYWKVDSLSKSNLAMEKFSGRLLFGESNLDKVLVETKEEKKAMPSSVYRQEREAKTRPSHSFCTPYNTGWGRKARDRPFKSFKYGMRNAPKHSATYRAGKGTLPKQPTA